jgi:hypothetical protein
VASSINELEVVTGDVTFLHEDVVVDAARLAARLGFVGRLLSYAVVHGFAKVDAEELRVDVRLHAGLVEEVVLGLRATVRIYGEHPQHVVKTDEDRDLQQHRQATTERVDPVLLLELLHLLCLPLPVVGVLLLDLLHFRREVLHLLHRPDLVHERLEHDAADGEGQEDDAKNPRDRVCFPEYEPEDLVPTPQDEGHGVVDEVEH